MVFMKGPFSGVGSAAFILALSFLGSRILGVVRNMVLGSVFGTSPDLDAYFAAFRLPDLVFQLLAGAAMGSAFIPTFANYWSKGDTKGAWYMASSVLNIFLIGSAIVASGLFFVSPWLVPLLVPGFSPQGQTLTVELTRIMLASSVFFCAGGIITGILNARHHFLAPALAPLAYNLSIIGGALWLSGPLGVRGPAIGVTVGAALHLLIQLSGLALQKMTYHVSVDVSHSGVKEVGSLMMPRVLGMAAAQGNFIIATVLASNLQAGSLAALNYAWALMMMPLGVFGMAISTAFFPALAETAAAEHLDAFRRGLIVSLRMILFLTIPASLGLIVLREPLVALLFERGLFSRESTQAVAWALLFYTVGLFAHAMIEILARGFYAIHDTRTPLTFSAGGMLLNLVLSFVLMGYLGHGGLALAMSLAATFEALGLLTALYLRLNELDLRELASSSAKTTLASAVMAIVLVAGSWIKIYPGNPTAYLLVQVIGGTALGSLVFLAAAHMLGSREMRALLGGLRELQPKAGLMPPSEG